MRASVEKYKHTPKNIFKSFAGPETQSVNSAATPQRAHILRSSSLPNEETEIQAVLEINKTEDGVDVLTLVEWRHLRLHQLTFVKWQEVEDRPEVKELVNKVAYDTAKKLSAISGASGQIIFVSELEKVILNQQHCAILGAGGRVALRP